MKDEDHEIVELCPGIDQKAFDEALKKRSFTDYMCYMMLKELMEKGCLDHMGHYAYGADASGQYHEGINLGFIPGGPDEGDTPLDMIRGLVAQRGFQNDDCLKALAPDGGER
jgi:hypothetical protein